MKILSGFVSGATVVALLSASPLMAADSRADTFMKKAVAGNLAEIKVGQLAQQKGGTGAVRDFGAILERDHSKANQQAMAAASSIDVTPPGEPGAKEQAEYQRLASLSSGDFDRAFLQEMVKDHKKDIAAYRKEAMSKGGPAQQYAKASLPTLEKHLRMAESLEHGSGK